MPTPDLEPIALLPELQDPTLFPAKPAPSLGIPPLSADPSLLWPPIDVDVPHSQPDLHMPPPFDPSPRLPQWLLPQDDGPLAHYAEVPPAPVVPPAPAPAPTMSERVQEWGKKQLGVDADEKGLGEDTENWKYRLSWPHEEDELEPYDDLRPQDKLPGMEDDD
jgi:hypothetical protein